MPGPAGKGGASLGGLAGPATGTGCLRVQRTGDRDAFGRSGPVGWDGLRINPSGFELWEVRAGKPIEAPSGSNSWQCLGWWTGKSLRWAFGPMAIDGKVLAAWRSWRFSPWGEAPGPPSRWSSRLLNTGLRANVFGRRFGNTGLRATGLRESEAAGLTPGGWGGFGLG